MTLIKFKVTRFSSLGLNVLYFFLEKRNHTEHTYSFDRLTKVLTILSWVQIELQLIKSKIIQTSSHIVLLHCINMKPLGNP